MTSSLFFVALFWEACIPKQCIGIVEIEVELLTGRTHQIRGQLSAEGFPLVGDGFYGGAIPHTVFVPHECKRNNIDDNKLHGNNRYFIIKSDYDGEDGKRAEDEGQKSNNYPQSYSEKLALQCCELLFLKPKAKEEEINSIERDSGALDERNDEHDQWNVFRLEEAWWSSHF